MGKAVSIPCEERTFTRGAGTPSVLKVVDKVVPFRASVSSPVWFTVERQSNQEDSHGEGAEGHIRSP
jgi:hypothetical protein